MIVAIIQARMGSSRLPGKVMLNIMEKPVLWHVVKRVKRSKYIDKIIVATSKEKGNDIVREFCTENNIICYSGNENDVLDRFYKAATSINLKSEDTIVRITADCPLIDSEVIDKVIETYNKQNSDYATNVINPTFPDGLDCEVMKFSVLAKAWQNASLNSEREHVTLYIRNHPEMFKISGFENDQNLSTLRWTLDEQEDYRLIKIIYERLYNNNPFFSLQDILDLLESNPELRTLNTMHTRNQGLIKSLSDEKKEL